MILRRTTSKNPSRNFLKNILKSCIVTLISDKEKLTTRHSKIQFAYFISKSIPQFAPNGKNQIPFSISSSDKRERQKARWSAQKCKCRRRYVPYAQNNLRGCRFHSLHSRTKFNQRHSKWNINIHTKLGQSIRLLRFTIITLWKAAEGD